MMCSVSDPTLLTKPSRSSGATVAEKRTASAIHWNRPEPRPQMRTARRDTGPRMLWWCPWLTMVHLWKDHFQQAPRRCGARCATTALLCVLIAAPCQVASAQPDPGTATNPVLVTDSTDKTGTNPANLLDTVEVSNAFFSHDDGLFTDRVTWSYRQAFANRRFRARVDLPLIFANVTGRTEVGFGDVVLGGDWLAVVRTSTAFVAGLNLGVNSSTNEALAEGHHTVEPSIAAVFVPRRDTVLSLHYQHRLSLGSREGWPDMNRGALEASFVRRFADGTWLRAIPAAEFDYEQDNVHTRLDGEWGRVLVHGLSTWVRVGGVFGASAARPFDWSILVGFRLVQ